MNFILTTTHSNNYEYYKNRLQYFLFEYKPESVNLENILFQKFVENFLNLKNILETL